MPSLRRCMRLMVGVLLCSTVEALSAAYKLLSRPGTRRIAQPMLSALAEAADFPDVRTRRVALEQAFTAIDVNRDELIDVEELSNAGFDAKFVLGMLDSNDDGSLTRDEFVDAWLSYEVRMSGAVLPGDRFIDAVDWFPDEQSRRQALEAAFDQIDEDDSASLDPFELQKAGFDAKLVMEKLDSNRDGSLSREEFVDQMLSLASNELTLSAWELENLLEAQRRNSLVTKGKRSVWGSRTIRRAVETPKFELVSLVALLAVSLSYAIGTLESLGETERFWLTQEEDFISVFFAVEFLLRWWGTSFSKRAVVQPTSIIDFLSFAPLLFRLALTGEDAGFVEGDLAFLRLLRVLRLQRFLQDTTSFKRFGAALGFESLNVKPFQLEIARVVTSIFTLLFIATGLIYNAEHVANPDLPDYFTALYFGLTTLTTVGFGDITPVTFEGRLVVSVSILAGIAIIPVQLSSLAEALLNRDTISRAAEGRATVCSQCGANGHNGKAAFCYACGSPLDL